MQINPNRLNTQIIPTKANKSLTFGCDICKAAEDCIVQTELNQEESGSLPTLGTEHSHKKAKIIVDTAKEIITSSNPTYFYHPNYHGNTRKKDELLDRAFNSTDKSDFCALPRPEKINRLLRPMFKNADDIVEKINIIGDEGGVLEKDDIKEMIKPIFQAAPEENDDYYNDQDEIQYFKA